MRLRELANRYDELLRTDDYADVDASANGLQVAPDEPTEVEHVAFAVDGVAATVEEAIDAGADVLAVHHGVSWGGFERVTGRKYRRIAPLIENDLALYVSHLPLDGHQEVGNAAGIADMLDLEAREPFAEVGPEHIGQYGEAPDAFEVDELRAHLDNLEQGGQQTQVLDFGPDRIESIAIATGAAADWLDEAVELGADAFVLGEGKQKLYHEAREAGINVFLAGHYATETFGVQSLQDVADDWGLETTYIEHPTGL